jgi:hypothetical protein
MLGLPTVKGEEPFFHLISLTEALQLFDLPKPMRPLITGIRTRPESDFDFRNVKVTSALGAKYLAR